MSTLLQERLADEIIANKARPKYQRKNKGQMLEAVGYDKTTAKAMATRTIEQKGVQKAIETKLREAGLTETLIANALVDDIEAKPKRRVRELELGAAILGMTEHEKKGGDKTLIVIVAGESANRFAVQTDAKQLPTA